MNATPWTTDNPFLRGAFAPVFDERDDVPLRVEGRIPPRLRGVLMRNGPNPLFPPDARYAYPFDGTGMIHALYLENGQVRYRNRWVRTQEWQQERTAGKRLFNSSFSPPPHADLANTNIIQHGGRYLALYEGAAPYAVDRDLNTVGLFDYGGKLPGAMSAHPKQDPATGELLSITYNLRSGQLHYLRANSRGELDRIVAIQPPWSAMVHDVAITERYVVAFICPLVFDFSRKGPPAAWEPDRGTTVAVIPRDAQSDSEVKWVKGTAFFHWHTVNAFGADDHIEVTLPRYESYSLTAPPGKLELHRITIDLKTGTFGDQALDDRSCEFGRVNDAYVGRRARYGYVGLRSPTPGAPTQPGAFEAFARYDLANGTKTIHQFAPGMTVCEPVFARDPDGSREEDGFILSFVNDTTSSGGKFVVLNARDLAAKPLAVVHLPRRVPAGLHGSWIPA